MQLDPEILEVIYTNKNRDLKSISDQQPVLLIFLRHFGCTFCRETLSDMAKMRAAIEKKGILPIMVHMAENNIANTYFRNFKIPDIEHVSDPDLSLYEYFGLFKGTFTQLYGLKIWMRGVKAVMIDGLKAPYFKRGLGKVNQMPGLFIIDKGVIEAQFVHHVASDRPNYLEIIEKYMDSNTSTNNLNLEEGGCVG